MQHYKVTRVKQEHFHAPIGCTMSSNMKFTHAKAGFLHRGDQITA